MPGFTKGPSYRTPFGKNEFLRSTQDIKTESYTVASAVIPARTIDGVALLAGLSLVDAAMRLARLELAGWVAQADGWFECVGAPLR